MSYYEGVVLEYLRVDRAMFVNPEYCIQIGEGTELKKGSHWYCDFVSADFRSKTIFLCEISYAAGLGPLLKRLREWNANWDGICKAMHLNLLTDWPVRPWLFVPEGDKHLKALLRAFKTMETLNFKPVITPLDMVQPWKYPWNRNGEADKPNVPEEMRA